MLKKRILSLISVATLLLQIISAVVCVNAVEEHCETLSGHLAPDLLENEIIIDNSFSSSVLSEQDLESYLTHDEALEYAREQFVNRERTVFVNVRSDVQLSSSYANPFFEEIIAHTGNPKEGDYLHYNMIGYSTSTTYTLIDGVYYYTLTYRLNWLTTAEQEKEVDDAVANLMSSFNLSGKNGYDKIKMIYDYICDNMKYDYAGSDDDSTELEHSTYAAIIKKTAVCQGFATLFYRLCLEADIDARVITGYGEDERHAWNIVQLNGLYYECDPTWDLGITVYYRYFMCTKYNFVNHTRDSEFNTSDFNRKYPMAEIPYGISVEASGKLNSSVSWFLSKDGTLTISGQGAMPDFKNLGAPWYPYADSILKIVLEEGITVVGDYSFLRCKNATEVVFPSTLKEIHYYGFDNCRSLKSLNLPYGLTAIEDKAFSECMALTRVELPDSVTRVEHSVFALCQNLAYVKLSAGMKGIPDSMFFGMGNLTTVIIPEGITSIGDTVFRRCSSLRSITIPSQITSIGVAAFADCASLSNIYVAQGNQHYTSVNGVLFSKDMKTLISYPAAKYGPYVIPDGVTTLAYAAFGSSRITSVTFPDSLREIGIYAFTWCDNLTSVTIGKNVQKLGSTAFGYSKYLRTVVFENPNTTLDWSIFTGCTALTSVILPSNLKKLDTGLFSGCSSLKTITIPSSVTELSNSAFSRCSSLVSVTVPASVRTLGYGVFSRCTKLQSVKFLGNINSMNWDAFGECPSLRYIRFAGTLGSVDSTAFDDTTLKTVYFDNQTAVNRITSKSVYGNMLNHIKTFAINSNITNIPSFIKNNYTYVTEINFDGNMYTLYSDHRCYWTYDSGKRCGTCNAMNTSLTHTHSYTAVVTPPTCTAQGYTTYTCSCGYSYKGIYLPSTGHSYTSTVSVKATCTSPGILKYSCQRCSYSYTANYYDYTNHLYGTWSVYQRATCTEAGSEMRSCGWCYNCEFRTIPAKGHSYISAETNPTCTEQGYTTHTCSECENSYIDTYLPAKGHSMGTWTETKAPTCSEKGTERSDCADCDHYETRDIDTIAHIYTSAITPPTHTSGGYTTHTCTVCGHTYNDSFTEPLTYLKGDINGDGKVNNLDAARLMQYIAGWDVEYIKPALDTNGDGKVNNLDAARLMQYIAGWDVELH